MRRLVALSAVFLVLFGFVLIIPSSHASLSTIHGTVYWYDQYGNLRPLPWVQVIATGEDGESTVASSTADGAFIMWVVPGTYDVTASSDPGFVPETHAVTVPDGGVVAVDFYLEPTGKPIPEYPSALQPVMLIVAALAAVIAIRRRRRTSPAVS